MYIKTKGECVDTHTPPMLSAKSSADLQVV